jgi:diguanylate cyclase (GGDEF)-like protein
VIAAYITIVAIAAVDYAVDYQNIVIAFFYVIPIAVIASRLGFKSGVVSTVVSLTLWKICDLTTREYGSALIPIWNVVSRLIILLSVVRLVSSLKEAHERERLLARTDQLTGALNRLHFMEQLNAEIDKSMMYGSPFTIAYIDVDRFKLINDYCGHSMGDEFLRQTVACVRRTDTVARIGGDAFAILLSNTTERQAKAAIDRIQRNLDEMVAGFDLKLPVGHSIGWVSFEVPPSSAEEALHESDKRMYLVKKARRSTD